jgi:Flp pilus assembly protein TadD
MFWLLLVVSIVLRVDDSIAAASDPEITRRLSQIQQLIQKGVADEARKSLQEALTRFPTEPNLHNFLGVLEGQSSNYPAAGIQLPSCD